MNRFLILSITSLTLLGCSADPHKENESITGAETNQEDAEAVSNDQSSKSSFLDEEENRKDYTSIYTVVPPEDESVISLTEFTASKPVSWIWTPPRSTFTASNYILPAVESSEPALLSISEFEAGEGGNIEDNIVRWNSQFRDFEGAPVTPVVEQITFQGLSATQVAFRGEYMGAGAAWHKPDHTMIIVVLEQPTKRVFFKILGPTKTVNVHRDPLYEMLHSIELLSP
ncbi:MAG: hypothetical protein MK073_07430 [Phycisphaerales bacterium]|nr:hypothetical protein [Phycisphaerales bacterium]